MPFKERVLLSYCVKVEACDAFGGGAESLVRCDCNSPEEIALF